MTNEQLIELTPQDIERINHYLTFAEEYKWQSEIFRPTVEIHTEERHGLDTSHNATTELLKKCTIVFRRPEKSSFDVTETAFDRIKKDDDAELTIPSKNHLSIAFSLKGE